ncbi:expressed unknown protein [Seminavis robusta]|uniref:Uncharacterized protein n=1 Tax=Seminavis robusta TaxID=568900 RepID=A0A9N8DDQ8_9STRA|nr:expressed unknown protein [Seminavis robusta]|eukprot:Sro76_g041462.1  (113) ;mRNA; f:3383-3721
MTSSKINPWSVGKVASAGNRTGTDFHDERLRDSLTMPRLFCRIVELELAPHGSACGRTSANRRLLRYRRSNRKRFLILPSFASASAIGFAASYRTAQPQAPPVLQNRLRFRG